MGRQSLFHLFSALVLVLSAEEGMPLVDAAVDEVVELATALFVEVREIGLVAAVVEGVMGGAVVDLGEAELLLLLFLAVERALQLVLVDRLEGLAVVEGGVFSQLERLYQLGVDLLMKQLTVMLLQRVIHALQLCVLFH